MADLPNQSNNPFVGPRPIDTGEPIFGREQETRKLTNLLLANRIVLVYSPSGAGKTSLIQAALIPRLESRNFTLLPAIRVNLNPPEQLVSTPGFNPYVFSALTSLEECQEAGRRLPAEELARTTFNDYLDRLNSSRLFLIFDQFEEILTSYPMDRDGKKIFFEQVGEALIQADRWALFSIREDYLGGLDPYLLPIPTRFKHTFRLNLLEKEAAKEVVQNTAARGNVEFTGPAATRLIDDLTSVKVQLPDGTLENQAGLYVEPVHLQVVCQSLWENRDPNDPDITEDEIEAIGDVDDSLAAYYDQKLSGISREAGVKERLIRTWFDQQLITKTGVRSPVLMEPEQTAGLENSAIQKLVNAHLVRRDTRSGATWFELAHDRLISPIRRSNTAWFEKKLSILQRQAARWHAENRPDHLLLRGTSLAEAEAWAGANPGEISKEDSLFLEACREARRKEEAAQRLADAVRRSQTQRRFLMVVSIALLVAVFLGVYSAFQTIKVATQANSLGTQANSLSTLVEDNRRKSEDNATIAAEARRNAGAAQTAESDALAQKELAEAEKATANVLRSTAESQKIEADRLAELADKNAQVAFARQLTAQGRGLFGTQPDLAALLAAESYAITHTWESKSLLLDLVQLAEGKTIQNFGPDLPSQPDTIYTIALSPDRERLAWGTLGGFVAVWNYQKHDFEQGWNLPLHKGNVYSLAFSPDGKWLASGGIKPELYITDVESKTMVKELKVNNQVRGLAFNPQRPWLAVAVRDKITIWDTTTWKDIIHFPAAPDVIYDLAWSSDGNLLASGEAMPGAGVVVWNPETAGTKYTFTYQSSIYSIAWSPDNKLLAAGSLNGSVSFWNMDTGRVFPDAAIPRIVPEVMGVAFSPDGKFFARGSSDGNIILYSTRDYQETGLVGKNLSSQFVSPLKFFPNQGFNLLAAINEEKATGRSSVGLYLVTPQQPLSTERLARSTIVRGLAGLPGGAIRLIRDIPGGVAVADAAARSQDTASQEGEIFQQDGLFSASALSPAGDRLALWEDSGLVKIVALPSKQVIQSLPLNQPFGKSLALSPDGNLLAAGTCAAFNVETGTSNCSQGEIQVWDISAGTKMFTLQGHQDFVTALAFSSDGGLLASGSRDHTILLWDLHTKQQAGLPLQKHRSPVTSLAFLHGGEILASGSGDDNLILWDLTSRQPLGSPLSAARAGVFALGASPGNTLLAGYGDGSVLEWNVDFDHWAAVACENAGRRLNPAEVAQYFPQGGYQNICGN